jgi:hypothetical protein
MRGWKKIMVLVASSACVAVVGAACTSEVNDPASATGEAVSAEAPVGTAIVPLPGRDRCERECRDRFDQCLREGGPRDRGERARRCERERDVCSQRCEIL